jgi:hypothetical protein
MTELDLTVEQKSIIKQAIADWAEAWNEKIVNYELKTHNLLFAAKELMEKIENGIKID